MDQAMSAIDLIERILRLGQAARDRYHEYREDHRPPGLVEAWKTDQEINKGNRKLLQKLMTAYRGNDGMALGRQYGLEETVADFS